MLPVEVATKDIAAIYVRFAQLIDDHHWTKRARDIRQEIRDNRFLDEYLTDEHSIVLALSECTELSRRYGQLPHSATLNKDLYPALALAAQLSSVVDGAPTNRRGPLIGRIQGAMRNSDHMRGLRLELQAATHFVKAGHKVSWPDVETGQGGADLVLPDYGPMGLQIECKAISADKGRKVHRREALTFNHLLSVELNNCLRTLNTGLVAVLTVPDRLPSAYKDRKELAVRVKQQILAGVSRDFPDGTQIRIDDFDIRQLRRDERDRPAVGRDDVDRLTSTKNRDALLKGNSVGAVLFVVQSARDDSVVPSIFSTLRQASASQCDPSIPTLFVVGLDGVTSAELNEIAEHDSNNAAPPTALRRGLSDFLNSTNRGHVIGVSFLGRSGLVPSEGHVTVGSGRVYHFPKTDSRLWHESHAGLFGS